MNPESLGRLKAVIADAAIDGVAWEDALKAVMAALKTDRVAFMTVDANREVGQTTYPYDPAGLALYAHQYARYDTRIERVLKRGLVGSLETRDLMSPEEIARCPIHQEFYRLYPECWNGAFHILPAFGRMTIIIGHQSALKGPVGPEARAVMQEIAYDLARCDHLLAQRKSVAIGADDLVAMFDALSDGIVVLDARTRVVHMNRAAEDLCAGSGPLRVADGFLFCPDHTCRETFGPAMTRLHAHLQDESNALPAPIVLRGTGTRERHTATFFAAANRGRRYGVLQIAPAHPPQLPTLGEIIEATGLSPAEAGICRGLMEGDAIRAIADKRGVSVLTIQSQLRNIRAKLQVSRQPEIIIAVMKACGRL